MRGLAPFWIDPRDTSHTFPDISLALDEPDGLLSVGGDLSPGRLLAAYRHGIFPWYNHGQPILWWSPNPRAVLFPHKLHVSRSLRKTLRQQHFEITTDTAFSRVIEACSTPRDNANSGTWITEEMQQAYRHLFELGHAHSVECWLDGELVGGLYGLGIGKVFFGESMFSRARDASKVAFVQWVRQLEQWGYALVDCQVHSAHLESLGAETIDREHFRQLLDHGCPQVGHTGQWTILSPES
ncbi:Leucyl/phenylalanyl-tRNA--protein transferase [hydrothermal vent metagenome]|uniref:Leucyl/phenylalanyl-tRNA--protein transferase n=1 Tax=hydrothermal vent metagenome TaxID=652676 RepID=A0A3B1AEF5_9ZZZZ